MSGFPVTVAGRTVESRDGLAAALREDAHGGPRRPQDLTAADAWLDAMEESATVRDAVEGLLTDLIATETDPKVLAMITWLGGKVAGGFPEAAARRLVDGPPLPSGSGVQSPTIAEDVHIHARRATDKALKGRLAAGSDPIDLLRLRLDERSVALVDAFEAAVASGASMPLSVAERVAIQVASAFPDEIPRAAKAAKGLPEGHRKAFAAEVIDTRPSAKAQVTKILGK